VPHAAAGASRKLFLGIFQDAHATFSLARRPGNSDRSLHHPGVMARKCQHIRDFSPCYGDFMKLPAVNFEMDGK
jgi:hypothetical protein